MVAWSRIGVIAGAVAFLGACAQLPSAENVTAFAKATNDVAAGLKSTIEVNGELARRSAEEEDASKYIAQVQRCAFVAPASANSKPEAGDLLKCPSEPKIGTTNLPPQPTAIIAAEVVEPRRKLVEALGAYAKALGAAADQGNIQALETAAASLAATASTAISPLVGPTVPLIGPLFKLAGRGIGLAVGNAYAIEIRRIVIDTDPFVQSAVEELKHSVTQMNWHNARLLEAWELRKRTNLVYIASHTLVSRSEAYRDYRGAVAEAHELKVKVQALQGFGKILDKLGKAHTSLVQGGSDADLELADFIKLSGDVSVLLPQLGSSK